MHAGMSRRALLAVASAGVERIAASSTYMDQKVTESTSVETLRTDFTRSQHFDYCVRHEYL
jgi:hypothetical protein